MSNQPIKDLSTLADDVFVPILTNKLNTENWPSVMVEGIKQKLQELRNNIDEVILILN